MSNKWRNVGCPTTHPYSRNYFALSSLAYLPVISYFQRPTITLAAKLLALVVLKLKDQADMTRKTYTYTINTTRIDRLTLKLSKLAGHQTFSDIVMRITAKIGVKAEELTGPYPPQPEPHQPAPKISPRTGNPLKARIHKRYRRTGVLEASLTSKAVDKGNAWVALLGTKVTYAPYVWARPEDKPGQAWMHVGVWRPLATGVQENRAVIRELVESELSNEISPYFK
jgi:hypothetical protein